MSATWGDDEPPEPVPASHWLIVALFLAAAFYALAYATL